MNANRTRAAERGIVLVVTLMILAILAVVGIAFGYSARVHLSAARNARETLAAETAADSALAWALAVLADDRTPGVDSLDETWASDDLTVTVGGRVFQVRITDEERKLNVNLAARGPSGDGRTPDLRPALKRLLAAAGGSGKDADALCAWLDADTPGAHDDAAPKAAVPFIDALRAVPDLSPEVFTGEGGRPVLSDLLTTHPTTINMNTASEPALRALWDQGDLAQAALARRKDRPFRTASEIEEFLAPRLPAETLKQYLPLLAASSGYYTVVVRGEDRRASLTALVRRAGVVPRVLCARRLSQEEPS